MVRFLWFLNVMYHELGFVIQLIGSYLSPLFISRAACGNLLVVTKEKVHNRDGNTGPDLGRDREVGIKGVHLVVIEELITQAMEVELNCLDRVQRK